MTGWRRLRSWTGDWPAVHELLLAELRAAGALDLDRCAVDGSHVRALAGGGNHIGPSPVDLGRRDTEHHLIVEANGILLQISGTGENRDDATQLMPLVDTIPPIRGLHGRPRRNPRQLFVDRSYDHDKYRRLRRTRGITPHLARRRVDHGSEPGQH